MKRLSLTIGLVALVQFAASAWDYEGHRLINQLALSALPTNFPSFVLAVPAAERVAFLAGEPDRWRNMQDLPLRHCNGPEHYIDMEELGEYGLKPEMLPVFRYDFVAQLALIRQAHPEKFPAVNGASNEDHTRGLVGLLPWGIAENYAKLKSGFSYLRAFQEDGGTPEEIANAEANIIYVMGVMGHLVGDAAQPLHTTVHHHGWVGENPKQYSTRRGIHSWIDGGFFARAGASDLQTLKHKMHSAEQVKLSGRTAKQEEIFQAAILFLVEQNKMVEPLYQMDKDGKFSGENDTAAGKAFLEGQFLKAGQLLADLWFSAWQQAPADTFLKGQLAARARKTSARE